MKKHLKKVISVLLSLSLCTAFITVSFAADKDITISDPYEGVDWSTVQQYKTALHTHTNASDGSNTMKEMLEREYETGYDIVASTDHGTVNYSWSDENADPLIHEGLKLFGRSEGELEYLGTSGTFADGTAYNISKTAAGDDLLTMSDGRSILRIPYGIEQNAVSANAHMCSWFADFCDNSLTTYEDAAKGLSAAGGICVINHPGEYTKAKEELSTKDAYNENNAVYNYYINEYATLLEQYPCCIGLDVNSKGDSRTRYDRKLWDELLERFSANGENVFAIASSDAHHLNVVDTGCVYLLMDGKTTAGVRDSLSSGHFFAASTCLGNYDELVSMEKALKGYYGETELYTAMKAASDEMAAQAKAIRSDSSKASDGLSVEFNFLDDNGYCTSATRPGITSVAVDNDEDTITLGTKDALLVRFISNGKVIATQRADGGSASIDLDNYSSGLGDYVRAEVFGSGGIVYTQAFLINAASHAGTSSVVKGSYTNDGFLDCLYAIFNNWFDIIMRMIRSLF